MPCSLTRRRIQTRPLWGNGRNLFVSASGQYLRCVLVKPAISIVGAPLGSGGRPGFGLLREHLYGL